MCPPVTKEAVSSVSLWFRVQSVQAPAPAVLFGVGVGAEDQFSWHRKGSEASDGSPGA